MGVIAGRPPSLLPELAGYEFTSELGRGATGRVYLAQQLSLGRQVAIKQLRGASQGGSNAVERFRREGRALARMAHENIVAVYDMASADGDMYLVLEYVDGPTLAQLSQPSRLSPAQALGAVSQVAAALAYASGFEIIHRDLKPENVLIASDGTCKVADFGLAKLLAAQSSFTTQVGSVMGTPAYMSPEQAIGSGHVDERTDVYALGVVAYELFLGRLPFPAELGEVEMLEAHLTTAVPPPGEVVPGFPKKVAAVLMKALEKSPVHRYGSAKAFWADLDEAATREWRGWRADAGLAGAVAATTRPRQVAGDRPVMGSKSTRAAVPLETMVEAPNPALETQVDVPGAALETRLDVPGGVLEPAAASAPQSSAAARRSLPSIERTRVALPKYEARGRRARSRRWIALVGVIALLGALGVAGYAGYTRLAASRGAGGGGAPAAPASLAISDVSVALDSPGAAVGHCPNATFTFLAHVHGNGAPGKVVYQWTSPDGAVGPETTVNMGANENDLQARLEFSYSGRKPGGGAGSLKVLSPQAVAAAPVQVSYRCP